MKVHLVWQSAATLFVQLSSVYEGNSLLGAEWDFTLQRSNAFLFDLTTQDGLHHLLEAVFEVSSDGIELTFEEVQS